MSILFQSGSMKLKSTHPSETTSKDTSTFTSVTYPNAFVEGTEVVVIPMVQTFNGRDTPGVRIAEVTHTGFKIRMNELVVTKNGGQALSDGNHNTEVIGWVAFPASRS